MGDLGGYATDGGIRNPNAFALCQEAQIIRFYLPNSSIYGVFFRSGLLDMLSPVLIGKSPLG
jgi:hypothetical protein